VRRDVELRRDALKRGALKPPPQIVGLPLFSPHDTNFIGEPLPILPQHSRGDFEGMSFPLGGTAAVREQLHAQETALHAQRQR
jgi:hypothetical protein